MPWIGRACVTPWAIRGATRRGNGNSGRSGADRRRRETDVYPVDEHGALMQTHDLHWIDTITQMWTLAETCGLDALGHKQEDRPGDEYWSGDPCHFQAHGWRSMIPSAVSKEV